MRTLVLLLLLANLTLFAYIKLDSLSTGEGVRLSQQVQPDKITLLTPQQVAALGPAKMSALADVCVEWGPLTEGDKRAYEEYAKTEERRPEEHVDVDVDGEAVNSSY